jgi:hypothetical protein
MENDSGGGLAPRNRACRRTPPSRNAIALAPLVVAFGPLERPRATKGPPAPAWRYVFGALMTCAGLALLAAPGGRGYGRFGLHVWGVAPALAGSGLVASRIGRFAEPNVSLR